MPKQVITLTDGETWEVFDPEELVPEVLEITDEAFARIAEGEPIRFLESQDVIARWVVARGSKVDY